jgi:hypothetical protein
MTQLRKVAPGDEFDGISAGTWNALVDAARAHINPLDTNDAEPVEINQQYLIQVRNETDELIERFQPVGLEGVIVEPTDDEADAITQQFIADPVFEAVIPQFDHRSRFAILQESLQPGAAEVLDTNGDVETPAFDGMTGRALLYGITPARIDVTNLQHRFAQPSAGAATLHTVNFGGARVLWPPQFTSLGEQWTLLLLTGNGQATAGEKISGELWTHLTPASNPLPGFGSGKEPGYAVLRVWSTDPDNTLETQTRHRYAVSDILPTDPLDLPAGQSFTVAQDMTPHIVQEHPFQIIESTQRNGTYHVESVTWDSGAGESTIVTREPIPVVLDPITTNPVIDGVVLVPGGDRRIPTDRFEMVISFGHQSAGPSAWCQASHDGNDFVIDYVNC